MLANDKICKIYDLHYNSGQMVHHFQSLHHQFFHLKSMNLVDTKESQGTGKRGKSHKLARQNWAHNIHYICSKHCSRTRNRYQIKVSF